MLATDWTTISSLATAVGTLVLAVATFSAVRSANRSTQLAEIALQEQRRPVIVVSRLDDHFQKLNFADGHWVSADGGHAAADHVGNNVYLALSLRNVGSGIGVCQGWTVRAGPSSAGGQPDHTPVEKFRMQTRDIYIPAADIGMWQGALRNPDDPMRAEIARAIDERTDFTIELLYSDLAGRQRTITRFGVLPVDKDRWLATKTRHWFLDWGGPRAESSELANAMETIRQEIRSTRDEIDDAQEGIDDAQNAVHDALKDGSAQPRRQRLG